MWTVWTRDCGDYSISVTPIDERSYRVSVTGGGKTNLDGSFGEVTIIFCTAARNGRDITNANAVLDAFQDSTGIRGTCAGTFNPV